MTEVVPQSLGRVQSLARWLPAVVDRHGHCRKRGREASLGQCTCRSRWEEGRRRPNLWQPVWSGLVWSGLVWSGPWAGGSSADVARRGCWEERLKARGWRRSGGMEVRSTKYVTLSLSRWTVGRLTKQRRAGQGRAGQGRAGQRRQGSARQRTSGLAHASRPLQASAGLPGTASANTPALGSALTDSGEWVVGGSGEVPRLYEVQSSPE
jgi:hypothetical protein